MEALQTTFYETAEALQTDLDAWLHFYITKRPIRAWAGAPVKPSNSTDNLSLR